MLVTTTLNGRVSAVRRAKRANSAVRPSSLISSRISTPCACREALISRVVSITRCSRLRGSRSSRGSRATTVATRFPGRPASFRVRMFTGIIARKSSWLAILAARAQEAPQRARDRREHHVVHRAAELVLHLLHGAEVEAQPVEAAVGADLDVQRRRRRALAGRTRRPRRGSRRRRAARARRRAGRSRRAARRAARRARRPGCGAARRARSRADPAPGAPARASPPAARSSGSCPSTPSSARRLRPRRSCSGASWR